MEPKKLDELMQYGSDALTAYFQQFGAKERVQLLLTLAALMTAGIIDGTVRNTITKMPTDQIRGEVARIIGQAQQNVPAVSVPAPQVFTPPAVEELAPPPPAPPSAPPAPEEPKPKGRRRAPTPENTPAPAHEEAPSGELVNLRNSVTTCISLMAELRTESAVLLAEYRQGQKLIAELGAVVTKLVEDVGTLTTHLSTMRQQNYDLRNEVAELSRLVLASSEFGSNVSPTQLIEHARGLDLKELLEQKSEG